MANSEEKSLSLLESNNIGFLVKLKKLFSKLFSKNNDLLEKSEIESKENEKYKMFEDLYGENSIQQIQVLYENGKLEENEMPEEKIAELKKLYVNQIIQMDEDSLKFKNSL